MRDTLEAVRLFGIHKVLYWRLVYRHHMRWLHARGRHQFKTRPLDGLQSCDWCGAFEPTGLYANKLLRDVLNVANSDRFRDRAEFSMGSHPVVERIRGFLGEPLRNPPEHAEAAQRSAQARGSVGE